ncbi:MAG: hypothetical protein AB8I08_23735 [Sandaracinaceae bacterium]
MPDSVQSPSRAQRRFRRLFVPAVIALAFPLLACGVSGGQRVPACENAPNGDACSECCSEHGHNGHMYNSFGDVPCECM